MLKRTITQITLSFLAVATSVPVLAAGGKLPERPTKLISTACDLHEQETAQQGQSVCRYLCRNPDKTKVALVFSSSGLSQCRTPIERTIKVVIK
jgi:hypothetical protein